MGAVSKYKQTNKGNNLGPVIVKSINRQVFGIYCAVSQQLLFLITNI